MTMRPLQYPHWHRDRQSPDLSSPEQGSLQLGLMSIARHTKADHAWKYSIGFLKMDGVDRGESGLSVLWTVSPTLLLPSVLLSTFYVFNIEYQESASATLELIEEPNAQRKQE